MTTVSAFLFGFQTPDLVTAIMSLAFVGWIVSRIAETWSASVEFFR